MGNHGGNSTFNKDLSIFFPINLHSPKKTTTFAVAKQKIGI